MIPYENQIYVSRRIQILVERFLSYTTKIELEKTFTFDFYNESVPEEIGDTAGDLYHSIQNQNGNAHFLYLYSLIIDAFKESAYLKELIIHENKLSDWTEITCEMLDKPYFLEMGDDNFHTKITKKIKNEEKVTQSQRNFIIISNKVDSIEKIGIERFCKTNHFEIPVENHSHELLIQSCDLIFNFYPNNSILLDLISCYSISLNASKNGFRSPTSGLKASSLSSFICKGLIHDEKKLRIRIENYYEFCDELKQIRNDLIHNGGRPRKKLTLIDVISDGAFTHIEIDIMKDDKLFQILKNMYTNIFYWHQFIICKKSGLGDIDWS